MERVSCDERPRPVLMEEVLKSDPTLLSFRVEVLPQNRQDFITWQGDLNREVSHFTGFTSLEFLNAPDPCSNRWHTMIRFQSPKSAERWKESPQSQVIMSKLSPLIVQGSFHKEEGHEREILENVTELFFTKVDPHQSTDFRNWCAEMHEAEAKFPGFKGVYLQAPKGDEGHWITLLQFDSIANLENWLESKERKALLERPLPWIASLESNRMASSYAGWFSSLGKDMAVPPVWKQTMLVLLVLYPVVMLELKYLNPQLAGLSFPFIIFIGNAVSVTLIAFPLMPIALNVLGWWCEPESAHSIKNTALGFLTVIGLYGLELLIFSWL